MSKSFDTLTSKQLRQAADIKERIEGLERQLGALLGAPAIAAAPATAPVIKKGQMSPEGRARLVAAQKARWAKIKAGAASKSPAAPAPVKKFTMSAAAKKAISRAAKARWAAIRAAKQG
jgi:hypothetical protein